MSYFYRILFSFFHSKRKAYYSCFLLFAVVKTLRLKKLVLFSILFALFFIINKDNIFVRIRHLS